MYVQSFPGVPDPANGPHEFAVDRTVLSSIFIEDLERFVRKNDSFADLLQPARAKLEDLMAGRYLSKNGEGYQINPGCPRCRRPYLTAAQRTFCTRFQTKFLALWSDPSRRAKMIMELTEYLMLRYPQIGANNLDLVVNVNRHGGGKMRCVLFSKRGVSNV